MNPRNVQNQFMCIDVIVCYISVVFLRLSVYSCENGSPSYVFVPVVIII